MHASSCGSGHWCSGCVLTRPCAHATCVRSARCLYGNRFGNLWSITASLASLAPSAFYSCALLNLHAIQTTCSGGWPSPERIAAAHHAIACRQTSAPGGRSKSMHAWTLCCMIWLHRHCSLKNVVQAPHVLQASSQRKINDQAWQPLSDCTLAVAHAGGVSLWRHIDQSRSPAMHRLHLQKGMLSARSSEYLTCSELSIGLESCHV